MNLLPAPEIPIREYERGQRTRQELGEVDMYYAFDGNGGPETVSGSDAQAQRVALLLSSGYVRESMPIANLRAPLALVFSTSLSTDYVLDITCNELQEVLDLLDPTLQVQRTACVFRYDSIYGQSLLGLTFVDTATNRPFELVV